MHDDHGGPVPLTDTPPWWLAVLAAAVIILATTVILALVYVARCPSHPGPDGAPVRVCGGEP